MRRLLSLDALLWAEEDSTFFVQGANLFAAAVSLAIEAIYTAPSENSRPICCRIGRNYNNKSNVFP
jgi:hypothetical protein